MPRTALAALILPPLLVLTLFFPAAGVAALLSSDDDSSGVAVGAALPPHFSKSPLDPRLTELVPSGGTLPGALAPIALARLCAPPGSLIASTGLTIRSVRGPPKA